MPSAPGQHCGGRRHCSKSRQLRPLPLHFPGEPYPGAREGRERESLAPRTNHTPVPQALLGLGHPLSRVTPHEAVRTGDSGQEQRRPRLYACWTLPPRLSHPHTSQAHAGLLQPSRLAAGQAAVALGCLSQLDISHRSLWHTATAGATQNLSPISSSGLQMVPGRSSEQASPAPTPGLQAAPRLPTPHSERPP